MLDIARLRTRPWDICSPKRHSASTVPVSRASDPYNLPKAQRQGSYNPSRKAFQMMEVSHNMPTTVPHRLLGHTTTWSVHQNIFCRPLPTWIGLSPLPLSRLLTTIKENQESRKMLRVVIAPATKMKTIHYSLFLLEMPVQLPNQRTKDVSRLPFSHRLPYNPNHTLPSPCERIHTSNPIPFSLLGGEWVSSTHSHAKHPYVGWVLIEIGC